jgi:hypothetical protein
MWDKRRLRACSATAGGAWRCASRIRCADEFLRCLAEGASLRDGKPLRVSVGFLGVERVYPVVTLLPVIGRPSTRFREGNIGVGAESHIAALAVDLESEHPRFCAARRDAEVEPTAIMQHPWPLRLRRVNRCELANPRLRRS